MQLNLKGRRPFLMIAAPIGLIAALLAIALVLRSRDARIVDRMVQAHDFPGAIQFLEHHYDFHRHSGQRELRRFALAVLRQGLTEHDDFERCFAATGLAVYGDWSGMPAINAALSSNKDMLQRAAIEGLADARNARALNLLSTLYRHGKPLERVMVTEALANSSDHRALPILLEATRSEDPEVRTWSVLGIGRTGDPRVLRYLRNLQGSEQDTQVNTALAHSELRLGDRSLGNFAILETVLFTGDSSAASAAALALGDAKDQSAMTQLREALGNRQLDLRVRLAAAVALTRYGDRDGLRLVNDIVGEPYERGYLPPLFNDLNLSVGRGVLLSAMSSKDIVLQLAAIEAMGRLGSAAEIGVLTQALERAHDPYLVAQIAWSLGRIGDPRAIAPLLGLAGNKDAPVRDTAADALARIASARLNGSALGLF